MHDEEWIQETLDQAKANGLDRHLRVYPRTGGTFEMDGKTWLNFSSNDYLDLARHPALKQRACEALETLGAGATASRLVTGTLDLHDELESQLARHKGYPAALVFGSGYLANLGAVGAMVDSSDLVFADRLVHASLIDAVRLSGARLLRFRHNDPDHLGDLLRKHVSGNRRLIITESVFSMDGDLAPLREIAELAAEHQAMLLVDEAHATGIMGPGGSGRVRELGLEHQVNVSMGTLSKGLGGYGGFVACSNTLRDLMIQKSRSFIYTTALPPPVIGAALGALQVLHEQPDIGKRLLDLADRFRSKLQSAGLNTLNSQSQIVPVLVGDNQETLRAAVRIRERGIIAIPMRPPTVPPGTSRLRLSVSLAHSEEDLDYAARFVSESIPKGEPA